VASDLAEHRRRLCRPNRRLVPATPCEPAEEDQSDEREDHAPQDTPEDRDDHARNDDRSTEG